MTETQSLVATLRSLNHGSNDNQAMTPESVGRMTSMEKVTFKGVITSAYGKEVNPKLSYEGSYDAYGTPDEVKSAGDWPNDKEVVKLVNNKRKAAAKAASVKATLDAAGIEAPTLENDVQLQLMTVYKALMAGGKHTEESARAKAAETIGAEWDDE